MTAGVVCTALRTNDVYGPAAAPTELGAGAIWVFTRHDRAMALIWGLFRSVCLKEVSFRQSSTAGSCSLCEFNIIPRLPTRAVSWDRGRLQGGGHPQGVPLRLDIEGAHTGGGHPQGVPLRLDIEGAHTKGEGTHKGCPYGWIMRARTRGEGTHKGCPYGWIMRARTRGGGHPQGVPLRLDYEGAHTGGGHPQGVPLRLDYEGAHTGGRAPTRGAPTVGL